MASKKMAPGSESSGRSCGTRCSQVSGMVAVMNDLRKQGALCDVTLVAGGRHFSAHRVVLAAASEFFRLMFTTGMTESASQEVELKEAEPDVIELLIDFMYTASISVNRKNVQSLLQAANQYQMDPVKSRCVEFLEGQIDPKNCLGISALAEFTFCPELKAKADSFAQCHFTKVSRFVEFLQLDVGQLTHLLRQDKLGVSEEQIYEAARRWLMHDIPGRRQHLAEVFSCIRFPLISKTFLSTTVQAEPLIQDNPQCLSMLISGMRCHLLKQHKDLERIRPRLRQTHQLAVYSPHSSRFFNPKVSSWTDISCSVKQQHAAAVCWEDVVYIIGGSSSSVAVQHMSCYNTWEERWYSRGGPPTPRSCLAACVTQGKVYTCGGEAEDLSALDVCESYDTRTESWQVETGMLAARRCHGCVEVDGLVYVCGGEAGDQNSARILNSLEVYNPDTRRWRALCAMKHARKNHGLVVLRDRIYAIGGQGPRGNLKSVEFYNTKSNAWRDAAPMPWLGRTVKCAAADGVLFVLAGRGVDRLRHVLEYCPKSDRWAIHSAVPAFPDPHCMVCAVHR